MKEHYLARKVYIHAWKHLSVDCSSGNMRVGRVMDVITAWMTIGEASRRDWCICILEQNE